MATIFSHPALPLALGLILGQKRIPWPLVAFGIFCSVLPDVDVLTFRLGIAYESPFGHRGFTHSIMFAASVALLTACFAKKFGVPPRTVIFFIFFSTVSHGVLDAFTTGGHGVEFFWPFFEQRFFFPWQFIRVSPIGVGNFLTQKGWYVLESELLSVWLPCVLAVATAKILSKQNTI